MSQIIGAIFQIIFLFMQERLTKSKEKKKAIKENRKEFEVGLKTNDRSKITAAFAKKKKLK